jgi:hypothetical protein
MADTKLTDAFHLMWDEFPEGVILVHKDRTIIATNKAGEKPGCQINTKCFARPPIGGHQRCKANEASHIKNLNTEKIRVIMGIYLHFGFQ